MLAKIRIASQGHDQEHCFGPRKPGAGARVIWSRRERRSFIRMFVIAPISCGLLVILFASIKLGDGPKRKPIQVALGTCFRWISQRADGAFVKLGQILATRSDLCPKAFLEPLSFLFDRASQRPPSQTLEAMSARTRQQLLQLYRPAEHPSMLAGSVAQIHRGIVIENAVQVAIKAVRQDTRQATIHDAVFLRRLVRRLARMRKVRRLPVFEAVSQICRMIILQFDLKREASIQSQMRALFASRDVKIAEIYSDFDKSTLVMEWLDDLRNIDSIQDLDLRRKIATQCLHLLYEMIFVNGLVHCDFHPGNLCVLPNGKLVILDFGLSARIEPNTRRALAKFFLAIATNDAGSGVEVILDNALAICPDADIPQMQMDIELLFNSVSQTVAKEFVLADFIRQLFLVQARNGVTATPAFTLPILALGVLEGRLKAWYPELDFQRESFPFVLSALNTPDPGEMMT